MLEMLEKRTSKGQQGDSCWDLTPGLKDTQFRCGPVSCVFLLFLINKSIFVELVCFCSVDQHLVLFKHVENNENSFNNGVTFSPWLPLKNRCPEPTEDAQRENKRGPTQDQTAGQPTLSKNLAGPLRPPACSPRVTQAEELSIKTEPDSTSPKQTRH